MTRFFFYGPDAGPFYDRDENGDPVERYANHPCDMPAGTYGDVYVGLGYTSTITLLGDVTFGAFTLESGTIDQPDNGANGSDLTIDGSAENNSPFPTTSFYWIGGTINSTTNQANVTVTGEFTTALIDPDGGALTTGSNLNFANGAVGTIVAGTVNFNNGAVYNLTETGTLLTIDTSLGDVVFQQPAHRPRRSHGPLSTRVPRLPSRAEIRTRSLHRSS